MAHYGKREERRREPLQLTEDQIIGVLREHDFTRECLGQSKL